MANLRDIKRRIKSVRNTAKITRTMELIATAKSQTCMNRIKGALPYFHALAEVSREALRASGGERAPHPLLERREVKRVALLVVVSNRGLCGGYNGNCLRFARDHRERLMSEGREVQVIPSGKKAMTWLKFRKVPFEAPGYTQFDDRPRFADVEQVADRLTGMFLRREVDRVDVCYTHFFSAGRQAPVIETVLPLAGEEEPTGGSATGRFDAAKAARPGETEAAAYVPDFIIEPDPETILDALFPLQAKLHLFRVYLEAATSEQIARRVAMKNATENAGEVGRALKTAYNRARQSQITNQILEVLGGAEALK